jgi:hypothetical protein
MISTLFGSDLQTQKKTQYIEYKQNKGKLNGCNKKP